MQEDRQRATVQRQPGHDLRENGRGEGDLVAPVRMRPHRAVVPAPEVHVEARLDSLPQDSGRSLAVGVIVNVGMVAADRAAILHRQRRTSKKLRSTAAQARSEEHTSELQSLMRISYAVFCLTKNKQQNYQPKKLDTSQH